MQIFAKTRLTAIAAALAGAGFMVGCGTSVPDASPIISDPETTVTGQLTDAVTGEPIVGAKVIIEGINLSDTTDDNGVYIIKEVPASVGIDGAGSNYDVSIDLTKVTSPVVMKDKDDCTASEATETAAAVVCNFYPDMDVLNATIAPQASQSGDADDNVGNSVSIGETGIVNAGMDFTVGKASASAMGHVFAKDTVTMVTAATVELWKGGMKVDSTTVKTDDATTETIDEGEFHFHGLQAGKTYTVKAIAADDMEGTKVLAGGIVEELSELDIDMMGRLTVDDTDGTPPQVERVSIDANHDFASDDTVAVTWTFSEAIALDAMGYRDSIAAGGELYEDIVVSYVGPKAGGVAKTVTWNDDFTQLTATIASPKVGSKYTMAISGADAMLEDAAGNKAETDPGLQENDRSFTVAYGGDALAAPASIAITNPIDLATVDSTQGTIRLYWPSVSGASKYYVYRNATVGGVDMGAVRIAEVTTNTTTDTLTDPNAHDGLENLVSDDNEAVSYTYTVSTVNGDGVESAQTDPSSALADKTEVTAGITASCNLTGSYWEGGSRIDVVFPEPMNEASAISDANYTGLSTGIKEIAYNTLNNTVSFHYDDSASAVCTAGGVDDTVTVKSVTDVAGNAIAAAGIAVTY